MLRYKFPFSSLKILKWFSPFGEHRLLSFLHTLLLGEKTESEGWGLNKNLTKWGLCDPPRTKAGGKPWWGGVTYHRQWGGKPGWILILQGSWVEPGTVHCPHRSGSQSSGTGCWAHGPSAGTCPGGWPRLECLPHGGLAAWHCSLTQGQRPTRPPLVQLFASWSRETTQNLLGSPAGEHGLQDPELQNHVHQDSWPQCCRCLKDWKLDICFFHQ